MACLRDSPDQSVCLAISRVLLLGVTWRWYDGEMLTSLLCFVY